ncbi:CocE/NonD family hydrolase [Pseudonocardia sp. GCM10023141]|uniref:CocE/NonD family hydrolase n=1 Tax=Pseudonocardia sp. GCM10023141 TaxID=3252653 RepID=UPI00360D56CB
MHGLAVDTNVAMTTRDGVTLRADLYRPAWPDPYPALLLRTPYDRTDPTLVSAIVADPVRLARQGYAVVVQDVRGRFGSGGDMAFFHQEQADGYDAVEWAATQPWCDGRVGIYGSSYHGMSAYQAVAAQPPHLRAAVAMVGATDLAATTHPGGLFELGFLTLYGLGHCVAAVARLDVPDEAKAELLGRIGAAFADPLATVSTLPLDDVPVLGEFDFWRDWLDGAAGPPTLRARPDLVEVPLLQVVAMRDFMAPTMLELAATLRGPHRTVLGPWAHGGTYTGHVGSRVHQGATGGVGTWGPLIAAWFDRHVRGRSEIEPGPATRRLLGEPDGAPVACYVTGEDRWTEQPSWPPPGETLALYLAGDAVLATALPPDDEPLTYRSDPRDPFPTCGGASSGAALGPDGVQDRRGVESRADLLVYTSAPLSEPLRVAGPVALVVHLASTAVDVDVCATLVDVEPDGFAVGISEGAQRARHRAGTGDAFLEPDTITEITVRCHDTAHTFHAGHRVRVEVAGANFPRLSRNLHTRTVPEHGLLAEALVAEQVVHHGAAYPSRLELLRIG